jgi:riboflavin kinase/FMN adenylyltransferase
MTTRTAVTVGNFDGVHRGHVALIERARELVGPPSDGGHVVALVFWPHPISRLRPDHAPDNISSFEQRRRWLLEAGADDVVQLEPTEDLLRLTPETFIDRVVAEHQPDWFVEGPDFHFGARRAGNIETLRALGRDRQFEVDIIDPVQAATTDQILVTASSTIARWLLIQGRMLDAQVVLGRPYEVEGIVVPGHQRGRELGYPTANIRTVTLLPRDGVYAGWATTPDGARKMAAISVGTNPTFGDRKRSLEAFILDWDGVEPEEDVYEWPIRMTIDIWLRDQVRYDSVAPLIAQIDRDVARVRDTLQRGSARAHLPMSPTGAPA